MLPYKFITFKRYELSVVIYGAIYDKTYKGFSIIYGNIVVVKMNEYVVIKIPKSLVDEMDALVGKFGFTSRAEITKEAIRRLLTDLSKTGREDS